RPRSTRCSSSRSRRSSKPSIRPTSTKGSPPSSRSGRPASANVSTSQGEFAVAEIRRVAVIGAGTMGHGIAQVAAMAGYHVALRDTTEELVQRGLDRIRQNLDDGVMRGKVQFETRADT